MNQLIIRKAERNDLDQLYLFEQGVIQAERPFDPTLKEDPINYYDLKSMLNADNVELAVAVINNTIVGSGYARIEEAKIYQQHQQYAYLGFMYVLPEYRGQGINQQVIEYLVQWGKEKGITEFRLEVYVDNTAAIKAYEKIGFSKHMIEMRLGV